MHTVVILVGAAVVFSFIALIVENAGGLLTAQSRSASVAEVELQRGNFDSIGSYAPTIDVRNSKVEGASSKPHFDDLLESGELEHVVGLTSDTLAERPDSVWSVVLDVEFSNSIDSVSSGIAEFIAAESKHMIPRTIYTEMNGFSSNPDAWFFNWAAYELPLAHPDMDFGSTDSKDDTYHYLTGMESLMKVYQKNQAEDLDDGLEESCSLMVLLKFQQLIVAAVETFESLPCPIVVSAHGMGHDLEIRRQGGVTFLGRPYRYLDRFEPIPTRFEQSIAAGKNAAFEITSFHNEPKWLHRVSTEITVDWDVHSTVLMSQFDPEPMTRESIEYVDLVCEKIKNAKYWPDFLSTVSGYIIVSERLANFLQSQPGAENAYHFITPNYPENGYTPNVGYRFMHLTSHLDCINPDKAIFNEDSSGGRGLYDQIVVRSEMMTDCRHIFRIPEDIGIYIPANLAKLITDAKFSGFHFEPVVTD